MTDETKTEAAAAADVEGTEPAWASEAISLSEQGVSVTDVAKAVGKRRKDVSDYLNARKARIEAEAAQAALDAEPSQVPPGDDAPPPAEPGAEGNPDGPPVQAGGTVTAEQAEHLREVAGDSSGDGTKTEPEPELFPFGSVDGDEFSHKSIGKASEPVTEITVAMSGGEVPMAKGSGLLDPHKEGLLLVTYECADGGRPIPIREGERGDKRITGWKTRQTVRPIYIERVKGEEGVIEASFAALLAASPSRAGALLDSLIQRAGRSLQ